MTQSKNFISIGECMIEMALLDTGDYRLNFAGDTLNTAWYARACLPKTDWRVAYFTRLGADSYSLRMRAFFERNGIDTSLITTDPLRQPGLYLVNLDQGERSFAYWRDSSAAKLLAEDECRLENALAEADLIYFSGITLAILPKQQRISFLEKIGNARRQGKRTAFDPNIRPHLWETPDVLREFTMAAASVADIVLPSFEDEAAMFGDGDIDVTASRYLAAGSSLSVVKNGGGPMIISNGLSVARIDSVEKLQAVDTTGAGDSFNGGFLSAIVQGSDLVGAGERAHRLASCAVMHRGALMPMADIALSVTAVRS